MYQYQFFRYTEKPSIICNYDQLVFGPIFAGKTSISEKCNYTLTYRASLFGPIGDPLGEPYYENGDGARLLGLPSKFIVSTDFGTSIPVNITRTEKLISEQSARGWNSPNHIYKKFELYCTMSWSSTLVYSLRKMATDFADRVFDGHLDILEAVYVNIISRMNASDNLMIAHNKIRAYVDRGHTACEVSYASFGLRNLNSMQSYGFALALNRYLSSYKNCALSSDFSLATDTLHFKTVKFTGHLSNW